MSCQECNEHDCRACPITMPIGTIRSEANYDEPYREKLGYD